MIYLDNGATSFHKPVQVRRAMLDAMIRCANPGRGGYRAAMEAANEVFRCRETAGRMFGCTPEQVVFTSNCTHGLNIAIRTLVKPGANVVISGFEHNAVTRTLYGLGAVVHTAGRKLFDWDDTLREFDAALNTRPDAAVFTHVSNVFGYILPVAEMAGMCRARGIPFVVDAAQSAGCLPVSLEALGADFIAMPGHKGLLGPQGTGLLLIQNIRNGHQIRTFGDGCAHVTIVVKNSQPGAHSITGGADIVRIDLVAFHLLQNVKPGSALIHQTDKGRAKLHIGNILRHVPSHAAMNLFHSAHISSCGVECRLRVSLNIHKYGADHDNAHSAASFFLLL